MSSPDDETAGQLDETRERPTLLCDSTGPISDLMARIELDEDELRLLAEHMHRVRAHSVRQARRAQRGRPPRPRRYTIPEIALWEEIIHRHVTRLQLCEEIVDFCLKDVCATLGAVNDRMTRATSIKAIYDALDDLVVINENLEYVEERLQVVTLTPPTLPRIDRASQFVQNRQVPIDMIRRRIRDMRQKATTTIIAYREVS